MFVTLQTKTLQDFNPNIFDNVSTEIKQLFLFLVEKISLQEKQYAELSQKYEILEQENAELKQENAELKARLNQNSSNSSRSPSSDGYRKVVKINKTERVKHQGGQTGHKGATLRQVDNPDEIVKCCPTKCSCGHEFSDREAMFFQFKRQVFDIPPPKINVTEYQIFGCQCPKCGSMNKGTTPEDVNSLVQYGNMAKSLVVLLNNEFKIPIEKTKQLFKILYGCGINESTITTILESCYNKLSKTEAIIKEKIKQEAVGHVDETGIRIEKKLNWLHVFSTRLYTHLFVHSKRGKQAIESEQSIIPNFKNWLMHDCWSSYFSFTEVEHALCNAHILRELQGIIDSKENGIDSWAKKMQDFLIQLYHTSVSECLKNQLSINTEYYQICRQGLSTEPLPVKEKGKKGRIKNSKARNLLGRLIKFKKNILAFAYNEEVPFTNNLAERDLRPAKIKLKISNTFRSTKGADYYARIQGFISTARKNEKNILKELYNTFNGYNFITMSA